MAKTKSAGTVKTGRESNAQYLGVKASGGSFVSVGNIIIRQRGTSFIPGKNVRLGKDDTIYSIINGKVRYSTKRKVGFDGKQRRAKIVNVDPIK